MGTYLIKHLFVHICSVNVHLITVIPLCKIEFNHFKSNTSGVKGPIISRGFIQLFMITNDLMKENGQGYS